MSLLGRILGNASEIPAEELSTKYERLLTDSEQVELGFKLLR
ncbi:MAG TPA: helicase, partial [Leeuwenhoekiella sp.]|nr:helicase [Leeuwenhoekiella sp.]